MQSIDETGKPRYRAACDACRQSKVRCSGGGVCIRCKKHDYKCRYSIAHRAGKPKGSKNKATLKKLESLQAAQQGKLMFGGGTGVVSTRKISRALTDAEFPPQRKRKRSISTRDIRARYGLVHPSHLHMRSASQPMTRKYTFAGPMLPVYPSSTSLTEPHLWEAGMPSTDMGFYNPLETMYGHGSSALASYLPSPSAEANSAFILQSNLSTVASVCNCVDRLDAGQRQISTLDPDLSMWNFDPTMELVTASLSSCHVFLSCAACSKVTGGSLWLLISVLDRSFDILNHLVLHRANRNNHEFWSGQQQQQHQQQCHATPYNYVLAIEDCMLEQSITTSYQIVRALRDAIGTEVGISGGVLGDISMHNNGFSSSSSSSSSSEFSSPASMETQAQAFILKSDQMHQTRSPECSALKNGKAKPSNVLSANEINFLLRTLHRYDTLIGNMQAVVAHNVVAATAHASPSSWPLGASDTTSQCGGGVAPYQPATTMEGFLQQPRSDYARFPSYVAVGLS